MRHRKSGKKLGRTWEHRKAMFRNMARSLITYGRIKTTAPKAKELSKIVDKLITLAKRNDLSARRNAYKVLENHSLVQKLFDEIGPKFADCKGGYTRVVKFATPRVGDSAAMAMIEFTYDDSDVSKDTEAGPAQTQAAVPASSTAPADASVAEKTEPADDAQQSDVPVSDEEVPEETTPQSSADSKIDDSASEDAAEPVKEEQSEQDKEK